MKPSTEFHMPAVVILHHDGGFTRVKLLGTGGAWGHGDFPYWDIPTSCVPLELRKLGSKVLVHHTAKHPEVGDAEDMLRAQMRDFVVEPLTATDAQKLQEAKPAYWARQVDWPPKTK